MFITGQIHVISEGRSESNPPASDLTKLSDGQLKVWCDACRAGNNAAIVQLGDFGCNIMRAQCSSRGAILSPSGIARQDYRKDMFPSPREMSSGEITVFIDRLAEVSQRLCYAGFDGIMLNLSHGMLFNHFLSPLYNQRNDQWGGSLIKRTRIATESIQRIRDKVDTDFLITVKVNCSDYDDGATENDMLEICNILSNEKIDMIQATGGEDFISVLGKETSLEEEGMFNSFGKKLKEMTDIIICVTGGFRSAPAMIESVEKGYTDLVGCTRAIILDDNFVSNVLSDPNYTWMGKNDFFTANSKQYSIMSSLKSKDPLQLGKNQEDLFKSKFKQVNDTFTQYPSDDIVEIKPK